ncbi:hypothetical protein CRG98_030168 [Punica granatum]|uniref:Uncharacterized protein n=1 Tax=Punica granatum TaxID=22663 RepID=A0A2I0J154_PUNGR|nr:hypothetical protein CRG98_030168 [Punica granatum]
MGQGPLADGRSGSLRTAATMRWAAVLAPGRLDDDTRGCGRWLWAPLGLRGVRFGLHRGRNGRNRGERFRPILGEITNIGDLGISRAGGDHGQPVSVARPCPDVFLRAGWDHGQCGHDVQNAVDADTKSGMQ